MDKGQKEYEAYVADQPHPKRFKPWSRLPENIRASFVPAAKPKAKAKAKKK